MGFLSSQHASSSDWRGHAHGLGQEPANQRREPGEPLLLVNLIS